VREGVLESAAMRQSIDAIVDRGLKAVEDDELQQAQEHLEEATKLGGENHLRVLHLTGMLAWAEGRPEQAAGYLMQAADAGGSDPNIYLDCAECLLVSDQDLDEAEAAARTVLTLEGVDQDALDQARLLLAQIRLADDDAEEALELLDAISAARKEDPVFLSTHGFVLLNAGRSDEAIASLRKAVEVDPEDPDVHYWLAQALSDAGDVTGATAEMLEVLRLDGEEHEGHDHEHEPLTAEIEEDLRGQFEGVLEELPEPVLKLVANAPITVQGRATTAQVREGADPRSAVIFLGRMQTDDDEAHLTGIVLMRDLLLDEIADDDDIPELLLVSLIDELRRFFGLEGLEMATGEE
jgi:Flp pilus assembly protein TadD/predicted Zn-dependent protease with MMP-like domain